MSRPAVLSTFHLRPRRIGGIETMVRELSLQLGERGWDSVLCFSGEPSAAVSEFLDLPNVRIETVNTEKTWGVAANRGLASLLRKYRPSILHLNFLEFLGPYSWLARTFGVEKVFYTDHISRPEDFIPSRVAGWKRAVYRGLAPVTGVFCVSDYVRECWIASDRLPRSKFTTIHNSVDIDRCRASQTLGCSFRRKHSIPPDSVVILQVASMIPEKGFHDLLHAARAVVEQIPAVRFVLAGDGEHRDEYVSLATRFGIEQNVIFTGLVEDPMGEGLFAAADIVCQPSRWNEAFGLVIAEAMACGKPVVGSRVGGIPELVCDGQTGFLVAKGDRVALAERIVHLALDQPLRSRLGQAGLQRCKDMFDHRKNALALIEHYRLNELAGHAGLMKMFSSRDRF